MSSTDRGKPLEVPPIVDISEYHRRLLIESQRNSATPPESSPEIKGLRGWFIRKVSSLFARKKKEAPIERVEREEGVGEYQTEIRLPTGRGHIGDKEKEAFADSFASVRKGSMNVPVLDRRGHGVFPGEEGGVWPIIGEVHADSAEEAGAAVGDAPILTAVDREKIEKTERKPKLPKLSIKERVFNWWRSVEEDHPDMILVNVINWFKEFKWGDIRLIWEVKGASNEGVIYVEGDGDPAHPHTIHRSTEREDDISTVIGGDGDPDHTIFGKSSRHNRAIDKHPYIADLIRFISSKSKTKSQEKESNFHISGKMKITIGAVVLLALVATPQFRKYISGPSEGYGIQTIENGGVEGSKKSINGYWDEAVISSVVRDDVSALLSGGSESIQDSRGSEQEYVEEELPIAEDSTRVDAGASTSVEVVMSDSLKRLSKSLEELTYLMEEKFGMNFEEYILTQTGLDYLFNIMKIDKSISLKDRLYYTPAILNLKRLCLSGKGAIDKNDLQKLELTDEQIVELLKYLDKLKVYTGDINDMLIQGKDLSSR